MPPSFEVLESGTHGHMDFASFARHRSNGLSTEESALAVVGEKRLRGNKETTIAATYKKLKGESKKPDAQKSLDLAAARARAVHTYVPDLTRLLDDLQLVEDPAERTSLALSGAFGFRTEGLNSLRRSDFFEVKKAGKVIGHRIEVTISKNVRSPGKRMIFPVPVDFSADFLQYIDWSLMRTESPLLQRQPKRGGSAMVTSQRLDQVLHAIAARRGRSAISKELAVLCITHGIQLVSLGRSSHRVYDALTS